MGALDAHHQLLSFILLGPPLSWAHDHADESAAPLVDALTHAAKRGQIPRTVAEVSADVSAQGKAPVERVGYTAEDVMALAAGRPMTSIDHLAVTEDGSCP